MLLRGKGQHALRETHKRSRIRRLLFANDWNIGILRCSILRRIGVGPIYSPNRPVHECEVAVTVLAEGERWRGSIPRGGTWTDQMMDLEHLFLGYLCCIILALVDKLKNNLMPVYSACVEPRCCIPLW